MIGSPNPVVAAENRPGITARALLVLLRGYQIYLSPMNFSACRFHPSCSHYAGEAVQRFGARRGVWLTIKRLARCQPFSKGGFDPVPDASATSHSQRHSVEDLYQSNQLHRVNGLNENGSYQGENHLRAEGSNSQNDRLRIEGSYQGTASAVPYSASNSGALAPANVRATRGQEFAQ